ncbi:Laminin-like protein epi-1 [Holothuria leucospilota]|uniref:Laminin-like protein epi-1 n=1 Tax=Holothuria leucospilota TaxID=206669 RepID=A0A9Q1CM96_HOLLE|nr:Laminin-like protein epi-1 [Holothuria leucospilota]
MVASTPESEVPPSEEALERLKAQVKEIEEKLKASEERADRAEEEVMQASMETVQYEAKIQDLEMQLSELEENKDQSESVTSDTTSSSSSSIAKSSSKENGVKETTVPSELTVIQNHVDKEYIARLEQKHCEQLEHGYKEIESLKISYKLKETSETELKRQMLSLEQDIVELKEIQKRLQDEKNLIDKNLENSQAENHRLQVETKQLKEQIGKSITSAKEAKKEIMELRDQLKLEKQACKTKDSAVQHAEELLTREKKVSQERKKKLEELEKTQAKSQKTTKNNEKELEKLKEQNSKLQKELEREKFLRTEVEKKVKRPAMFTRNEANIRKGQKKETDTEKTPKRIAEIEPVIAVKEGQIFQQRIPVTNTSKLSTNHLSEKQDSSSDAIALQKKELNGSRELSRLTDDLVRLRDRLHDTETKVSASPDGRQQVARLKTELSKSQEDIEKLISSCKKYEEEREAFQRELGRLHEVDSASMIGGISINQPYVVIAIAITAALAQIILAIWTAE